MIIPFTIVNIFLVIALGIFIYIAVKSSKKSQHHNSKKYTVIFSILAIMTALLLLLVFLQHYHLVGRKA